MAVVLLTLVVAFLETFGQWGLSAVVGTSVRPSGVAIVVATVLLGAPARWGLAGGMVVAGGALGDWSTGAVYALAAFTASIVCFRLWDSSRRDTTSVGWIAEYEGVALVTVVLFAATSAWLTDLLGWTAFATPVVVTVAANLPLAAAGGLLAWPLAGATAERRRPDAEAVTPRTKVAVAGTVFLWAGGGYVASFLYQAMNQVPTALYGRRLPAFAEPVVRFGGDNGSVVLTVFSLVSLAVIVYLLADGTFGAGR